MAAQAGPEPRLRRSLTGAGARAGGVAAIRPAPVVPLSQVAGDIVCLMEALGIDRVNNHQRIVLEVGDHCIFTSLSALMRNTAHAKARSREDPMREGQFLLTPY